MFRLSFVVAALVCVPSAFGAWLSMNVVSGGQEVTLLGSQQAQIEIWLHLPQGHPGWSWLTFDLGGSIYDSGPEDFVWTTFDLGPLVEYVGPPPDLPMPGVGAWVGSLYYSCYWCCDIVWPCMWDFLLGTLTIHSAGVVSTDLIAFNTGLGEQNEVVLVDFVGVEQPLLGPGVTIHQFPEATSLTLLALGGLVLIRRR